MITAAQVREAWCANLKRDCLYDPPTPDWQAIADELNATLGAGTCRLPETRIDHGSIEYNGTTSWRLCSACGAEVLADPANFCPNCGRRVMGC